jgi:pectin methylesterase-like acyl-CoA thioesterase
MRRQTWFGIRRWPRPLLGGLASGLLLCGVAACNSKDDVLAAGAASSLAKIQSAVPVVAAVRLEPLGPFESWADAKRMGAAGDGQADDTDALQNTIDSMARPGRPFVLYLPAGSYRITRSLKLTATASTLGFSLVGEDPANTRIVWDGPAGGAMFIADGGLMSRFSRITWDGRSRAGYGVAHWWRSSGPQHGGSPDHSDEVFVDMEIGIQGGRMGTGFGQLDSEGRVRRVKFVRNSKAGVNVGSWNALNWWVWDSHFVDCARGVSNLFTVGDSPSESIGAGNFAVYRSHFERSTVADAAIGNTGWFSLQHNTSIGSRRFFHSEEAGNNPATLIVQGNRVFDTLETAAIRLGNMGPLMLIDNHFRSTGASGPVVQLDNWEPGRDVVSIGNRYTVDGALKPRDPQDRIFSLNDAVVGRNDLPFAAPPAIAVPARLPRQVFEVRAGADATAIQLAIDRAVQAEGNGAVRPVVHLPAGDYKVDRPIEVPANSALQLAGDSIGTTLHWIGSAPADRAVLVLRGPSRATVRDLRILAGAQPAIVLSNVDEDGGRVVVAGSMLGAVLASQLPQTRLSLQANTSIESLTVSGVQGMASIGSNTGRVRLSGSSTFLMADTWYEGPLPDLYRNEGSVFTYSGGHAAIYDSAHGGTSGTVLLVDRPGTQTTVLGMDVRMYDNDNPIILNGPNYTAEAVMIGLTGNRPSFLQWAGSDMSTATSLAIKEIARPSGRITQVPDRYRDYDAALLTRSLAHARSMRWDPDLASNAPPPGPLLYGLFLQSKQASLTVRGD